MGSDKTEEFAPADVVGDEPLDETAKTSSGSAETIEASLTALAEGESWKPGVAAVPRDRGEDMHNLLAALVEQARAMAGRMAGDPERETTCHFCGGTVPLWESLLVMQLAGVPAHVACPAEILSAKLRDAGPDESFPYDEFSKAVDGRLKNEMPAVAAGLIEG